LIWFDEGLRDRENGPAHINNQWRVWYKKGLKHRIGQPASFMRSNMSLRNSSWFDPGEIECTSEVIRKEYWYEGRLYRENGRPPVLVFPSYNSQCCVIS